MRESVWDLAYSVCDTGSQGSGAGGSTSLTWTVPSGECWEILGGHAYHNDAARSCQWSIQGAIQGAARSVANDIPIYIYTGYDGTNFLTNVFAAPIRLNAAETAVFTVASMAASKTITGVLWVRKLRGVESHS